jgi:hypothetical protein
VDKDFLYFRLHAFGLLLLLAEFVSSESEDVLLLGDTRTAGHEGFRLIFGAFKQSIFLSVPELNSSRECVGLGTLFFLLMASLEPCLNPRKLSGLYFNLIVDKLWFSFSVSFDSLKNSIYFSLY